MKEDNGEKKNRPQRVFAARQVTNLTWWCSTINIIHGGSSKSSIISEEREYITRFWYRETGMKCHK